MRLLIQDRFEIEVQRYLSASEFPVFIFIFIIIIVLTYYHHYTDGSGNITMIAL